MTEQEIRLLLERLLYSLRASLIDREAMIGTLHACAKKTKVLEDWEETYKNISLNPSVDVSRRVDELLAPLQELVTRELDEKGFQLLLKHAQTLENYWRAYGR